MQFVPRPSRSALQTAAELGRMFGTVELRVQPILREAHQYKTYLLFITAHRHQLEQREEFEPWDAKLQKLIEQEGERCALQIANLQDWDPLYTQLGTPIRCSFWYAWEIVQNLQKKYEEHMRVSEQQNRGVDLLGKRHMPSVETDDAPDEHPQPPFAVMREELPDSAWDLR